MGLTNEHVGHKILAKIKIYVLTRAELLFQVCYVSEKECTHGNLFSVVKGWQLQNCAFFCLYSAGALTLIFPWRAIVTRKYDEGNLSWRLANGFVMSHPIARGCLLYALYLWVVNVWGKRFKLPQLTLESFLTLHYSCKIFFWYLPNWTSTNLWCVVLYATYSTTHQRSVEVQFGRYQKNILQEWSMVKKLSCVSCGSLKRFPHTFTNGRSLGCKLIFHFARGKVIFKFV